MSPLILVRHSTPVIDPAIPSTDWALSPAGIEAAERLAVHLEPFGPARLLSSPERKARETAQAIGRRFGLEAQVEAGLREHERATAGFLPQDAFKAGIAAIFARPDEIAFGEESAAGVFARFSSALSPLSGEGRTVVAVTHGTAISIYMAQKFGIDGIGFWRDLTTPMAVVLSPAGWDIVTPEGSQAR